MWRLATNFILFQSCWWAAFFWQNDALPMMAALIVMMLALSEKRKQDILLLASLPIALLLETSAAQFALLQFEGAWIPWWLVLLWVSLLLTINHSLRFITRLPLWQCFFLCWVCAPFSYLGAARFEVLSTPLPWWQFYLVYGLLWASAFTVIIVINRLAGRVEDNT
ncbi:DUF2878 domain-containing protein [Pseudoalteromonas sp. MM17-2]|uniref:DUF2878 domain-containing protein n=1 Tax=Pseudoalteromonas sp. MM17-2 TaxID=2917753 RepID=UPI001EF6434B|nr:DUF2878 domain-containing protein [Pseudoalteromonas sp. MM17-2]MCG7544166.1 DUF2878 domain-containing protein [Pseudoalteromonas sp. MM17-2]